MKLCIPSKIMLAIATFILLVCLLSAGFIGVSLVRKLRQGNFLDAARSASQEFLQDIHYGRLDSAYSRLSEKFEPRISKVQFGELIQRDRPIFSTYRYLEVCEWGLFVDNGLVVNLHGLLYYGNGVIVVQISLHKDSDATWRIQGFRLDSASDPRPYGLCK